jgi:septal ring factor EnvC (AmiA/AmiB activator)
VQSDPEQQHPLKQLAIRAGIYVGVFLAGGILSFAYSYGPLHSGKNWRIEYLEERVAAKDARITAIGNELAQLRSESEGKPDTDTFKLLQDELATTDKTIQDLERKLTKSERRVKELERSRSNWKQKLAESQARLEEAVEQAESEPERAAHTEPSAGAGPADAAAVTPAAPAPFSGAANEVGGGPTP